MPILICKRVRYGSQGDDTAFFDWIGRISCVTTFEGSGDTLDLHVSRNRISDANLRELLTLRQLAQFETTRNRIRFTRPGTYWFARVWGRLQRHGQVKR